MCEAKIMTWKQVYVKAEWEVLEEADISRGRGGMFFIGKVLSVLLWVCPRTFFFFPRRLNDHWFSPLISLDAVYHSQYTSNLYLSVFFSVKVLKLKIQHLYVGVSLEKIPKFHHISFSALKKRLIRIFLIITDWLDTRWSQWVEVSKYTQWI